MAQKLTEATIEEQIAALREQIASLTESVSSQAGSFREKAEDRLDEAKGGLRRAASSMREGGQQALETVRDNPGAATSVAAIAALSGMAVGYLIGSLSRSTPPQAGWTKNWR